MATTKRRRVARRRGARALPIVVLLALVLPSSAGAARGVGPRATTLRLVVTTTADTADVTPSAGRCADTSGRCSLRAALQIADARQVPADVTVPRGSYVVSTPIPLDDAGGVTIEGAGTSRTSLSGGGSVTPLLVGDAESLSLGGSVASVALVLRGVTLKDGVAATSGTFAGEGGCLVVASANTLVRLDAVRVVQCASSSVGGGVYSVGRLMLVGSSLDDDTAVAGGGGLYQASGALEALRTTFAHDSLSNPTGEADGGGADVAGTATITDATFDADGAVGDAAFGGGLDLLGIATLVGDVFRGDHLAPAQAAYDTDGAGLYAAGPVTVTRSTFEDNDATGRYAYGGGASSEGGFVLTDSTLAANVALGSAGGYGGGLYAEGGATVTATTFERNLAESATESYGGGLYVQDSTAVLDSSFRANTATNGVGGGVFAAGVGTYLDDSTFTRNHATGGSISAPGGPGYGGAIAADSATRVVGATILGNLADRGGGGLFVGAPVELDHSLVARNAAIEGAGVYDYWLLSGTDDAVVDNTSAGVKGGGGGLFVVGATGLGDVHSADLVDTVVAGNVAAVAGGIEFQGGPSGSGGGSFLDDDVADNETSRGAPSECAFVGPLARRPISLGGNVVGDTSCDLRAPTDRPGPRAQGVWVATGAGVLLGREAPSARVAGTRVTGLAAVPGGQGCLVLMASGAVQGVGSATVRWSAAGRLGGGTAVGVAVTPDGRGAWVASSDGQVVALGDAPTLGGVPGAHVVAIAASVDGRGYELLERDGEVRPFGDAPRLASRRDIAAVSLAMTPDGQGYWELAADGHVAAFGDARPFGAGPRDALAILASPDGRGYLVVTTHGAVTARGDAHDPGSLRGGVVAAAAT